jgi:RNA-directed DNA polymerase
MTNGPGKSDSPVVPEKSPNNAGRPAAEGMEGRGLAKGNLPQQNASRTPSRKDAPSALGRVRQAAEKDKKLRFTALLHHLYNLETLRMAYFRLKKEAAPGVDGERWRHYGEQREINLQDLSERLQRGAYRAKPVRRVYIPKADGRQRPLGVPALEDKIVQRAEVEVLNAIYETDFLGFFLDGIRSNVGAPRRNMLREQRYITLLPAWLAVGAAASLRFAADRAGVQSRQVLGCTGASPGERPPS